MSADAPDACALCEQESVKKELTKDFSEEDKYNKANIK